MSMRRSSISRCLSELFAPRPGPKPDGFDDAAGRLLHARHLVAYDWALPYIVGRDVLEIGVNRGYGSRILAPEAASFMGVDISYELASEAHRDSGVNVAQANGQRLPFLDATFDVVVTFQVIEHVWDVHAYLREVSRVLRPGGLFLVSTPQAKTRLYLGQRPWNDEHLREFDEGSWAAVLETAFAQVTTCGLFAMDAAHRIERRRTWQDAWQHFWGGAWAGPIRRLGRMVSRMRKNPLRVSLQDLQMIQADADEALLGQFYFDVHQLEGAHDLFAVCRKSDSPVPDRPVSLGTGISAAPLAWQKWFDLGRKRAYRRLLRRCDVALSGKRILDFACGTGYFEDVWEEWGSGQTCGIDIDPSLISRLERAHPERRYLCADIVEKPRALSAFETPHMVTAIDALYDIADDDRLMSVLTSLVALLPEGGYFLLTDAMREDLQSSPHMRFRSLNQWKQIMSRLGMEIVGIEPVFALNARAPEMAGRLPASWGALRYYLDLPVLRTMPWLASNWALLARRH